MGAGLVNRAAEYGRGRERPEWREATMKREPSAVNHGCVSWSWDRANERDGASLRCKHRARSNELVRARLARFVQTTRTDRVDADSDHQEALPLRSRHSAGLLAISGLAPALTGCEAIRGLFGAGFLVGIFGVATVAVLVFLALSLVRR